MLVTDIHYYALVDPINTGFFLRRSASSKGLYEVLEVRERAKEGDGEDVFIVVKIGRFPLIVLGISQFYSAQYKIESKYDSIILLKIRPESVDSGHLSRFHPKLMTARISVGENEAKGLQGVGLGGGGGGRQGGRGGWGSGEMVKATGMEQEVI